MCVAMSISGMTSKNEEKQYLYLVAAFYLIPHMLPNVHWYNRSLFLWHKCSVPFNRIQCGDVQHDNCKRVILITNLARIDRILAHPFPLKKYSASCSIDVSQQPQHDRSCDSRRNVPTLAVAVHMLVYKSMYFASHQNKYWYIREELKISLQNHVRLGYNPIRFCWAQHIYWGLTAGIILGPAQPILMAIFQRTEARHGLGLVHPADPAHSHA